MSRPGDEGDAARRDFVLAQTRLAAARLRPDIALYLASELTPLWQASEDWLAQQNVAPPYWAFAWPGAEAIAAHLAVDPALVAGRRVLDFAAGCGLAAIAAARAGAAHVAAAEIDPLAVAAIGVNAAANAVAVEVHLGDITGRDEGWEVIFCGDIFYEARTVAHILPWLRGLAGRALVLVADPGRAYLPREGLEELAAYDVPVTRELEDRDMRRTRICRLCP